MLSFPKSHRLAGYDYTSGGAYFITLCTQNRLCLFGTVSEDQMHLNDAGRMIETVWNRLPERFSSMRLDSFVIMPNHVHAIVTIENGDFQLSAPRSALAKEQLTMGKGALFTVDVTSLRTPTRGVATVPAFVKGQPAEGCTALSDIVGAFKSITTVNYITGVKEGKWPPFSRKLWQEDCYDRIIRSLEELGNVRNYILTNAARWTFDHENPDRRPHL